MPDGLAFWTGAIAALFVGFLVLWAIVDWLRRRFLGDDE